MRKGNLSSGVGRNWNELPREVGKSLEMVRRGLDVAFGVPG